MDVTRIKCEVVLSWRHGVVVSGMNEVNPCRAQLVLGWVTVFEQVYNLGM